jgi:MoCo/4Fe-4S cofactor protein with predicted Tat translocation signal
MPQEIESSDLSRLRDQARQGDAMWRSLEELSQTREFRESVHREFAPSVMGFDQDGTTRRTFLQLMGASMALAGVYGCSERPSGKILPYIRQPEQIVPGMPLFFATAMPLNGYGYGVLAESHEGRPTKIEGNPSHPASLGGTNIFMQASVLQLYDPERTRNISRTGVVMSWETFRADLTDRLDARRASGGKGVRILTGTVTSPTLASQLRQFLKSFPQARWHHYDPMARVNTQRGAMLAFGKPLNTVYRFRRSEAAGKPVDARVIVSLDSDFLFDDPGSLQYSRHFSAARKVRVRHAWQTTMNRLYVVESSFSLTGSMADHRIPARPADVASFAQALAARLGVPGAAGTVPPAWSKHLDAIAADLKQSKGESIVIVGESQPPEIHALGHAINALLGNVGKTVQYIEPVELFPEDTAHHAVTAFDSLRDLTDDMNSGQVDTLLILGGNPAYTAPADIKFADALFRLSQPQNQAARFSNFTAHLGLYKHDTGDETGYRCQWNVPEAHYLESWGDVRAFDGTASIIQPLIAPLFGGRSAIELMDVVLTRKSQFPSRTGYEIVQESWKANVTDGFNAWWARTLENGLVADSAFPSVDATVNPLQTPAIGRNDIVAPSTQPEHGPATPAELEIVFRPDPSVWDGTFSNNGWLQECPKFFTKLVWDNAALMSPRTAENLRLGHSDPSMSDGRILRFTAPDGRQVDAPVMVLPGLPENVVTMHFGYGRQHGGSAAQEPDGTTPRGFNAYALRHSRSPWTSGQIRYERTDRSRELVVTRNNHAMDALPGFGRNDISGDLRPDVLEHPDMNDEADESRNRRLVRTATLEYFNAAPEHRHFVDDLGNEKEKQRKPILSLYPGWDYSKGYQWGMSIDMQSCIGCNACLVACVAENNIPVVGRSEVARQREMHWIRIDQYFADDLDNPKVYHQPVTCMHCENAPCEVVCPVGATVHSAEGINMMVYNRCVGTRYCSNNCPYKVRRFNFFNWWHDENPEMDLVQNPEVTVRSRGVMEKCTYCIQRLQRTRIEVEKMIVRLEEKIGQLEQERKTAPADRQAELGRQMDELTRQRHNNEFESLEKLQTACQQACPTEAISFGNLLPVKVINENGQTEQRLTQVTKLKQEPTDYALLTELTTKPRTSYMARLRNPNPMLEPEAKS